MIVHRDTLANATDEQTLALRTLLQSWRNVADADVRVYPEMLGPAIMVDFKMPGGTTFTVGIEKDGYTHS